MSEQGIERARCSFCNYPLPAHSDICTLWHAQKSALATPPVPAGEVEELVERLRAKVGYVTEEADGAEHVTISAHVDPDCDKAAALLERYAAASSLVPVNRKVIGGRDED
jgi:hypothetical protein